MVFFSLLPPPPRSTLFPYTTLFRSDYEILELREDAGFAGGVFTVKNSAPNEAELFRADSLTLQGRTDSASAKLRSEEHTSELQSHSDLVCRLLLEKKKKTRARPSTA